MERECHGIGDCPTGEVRITDAYDLPCKHVIHAVAPRYSDGTRGEPELLRRCYQSFFALTEKHEIKSISIPAIGTGIYHYSIKEATEIAFDTTLAVLLGSAGMSESADFQKGIDAYNKKDYVTALREWTPLVK